MLKQNVRIIKYKVEILINNRIWRQCTQFIHSFTHIADMVCGSHSHGAVVEKIEREKNGRWEWRGRTTKK